LTKRIKGNPSAESAKADQNSKGPEKKKRKPCCRSLQGLAIRKKETLHQELPRVDQKSRKRNWQMLIAGEG
jgi:hypothetical protein